MGLWVGFDVVEDLGFMDATPIYGIEPDYSEGCAAFAETFYDIATTLVPVDTGFLQSTIGAEGDDTWCEAYAEAEYAQYVEYGTWKMAAQPYFEPAYRMALGEAMPLWQMAMEEAMEEEQERYEEEMEEMKDDEEGGIDFGFSLIGLLATMIVSAVIITTKVMLGADSSSRGSGSGPGGYIPEVEII